MADDLTAQQSGVSDQTLFTFRHVIVDTSKDAPSVCLRFSQNLNSSPAAHYEDYLQVDPAVKPSITVTGTDLCLGGLDYAKTYKLVVRKGLPAASGAKTGEDQKLDVALADQPPLVAIAGDGFVLSRDTANGLAIQTVNVKKVKIHVLRMSDKLLPMQVNAAQNGGVALNTQTMSPYDLRNLLQNMLGVAWTGTMDVPADHNRTVATAFPIASVVPPGRNGLYLVVAENAAKAMPESVFTAGNTNDDLSNYGQAISAHWVLATDVALTSFTGTDGLHVFARSLATAQPLSKVDLRLISNGQDTLGRVLTDASGQAVFPAGLLAGRRANAAATLLAYGPGGTFAFQDLTKPAFDLSDRGVSGRDAPQAYQAFMYTERGIYRPGETVRLMTLLRDQVGNGLAGTPLKLVLRRPDGVVDKSFVLSPAADGGFFQPITLSAAAALGTWTVEAYVDPTAAPVGRVQLDVQDFVPQQLKVTLTAQTKILDPSQPYDALLDGQFLYGAPAAGLHAQGDLRVVRDDAPIASAAGYSFGLVDDKVSDVDKQLDLDDADDKGNLDVTGSLPDLPATSVPLKAVLTAGLFEPSGRYVSDTVTMPIHARKLLIGIKPLFADSQLSDGQTAHFDVQAFDASDKSVAPPQLSWTLVEENQIFDWFEDNNSNWVFHYHTEDQQLASGALTLKPGGPTDFVPPGLAQYDWGTYRLIIADAATGAATSVRFNVGWNTSNGSTSTPDKAEILAEKPLLRPGETTKLHIKGPFAGQAQIVIANNRVFSTQLVNVPAGGTTVNVTADAAWGAGAYAIVTMVRPLNQSQTNGGPSGPVRAMGVAWLGIDPAAHTLAVTINAPAKVTPRQVVNIPVKITGAVAGDRPFVTLAAVDEGILQLTNYATPDPLGFLYGKLNLGMDIRDDYGSLLDGSAAAGAIHVGGDGGSLGGVGLPVESTKVVALFSGPVTVAADGTATIAVQVPDFEGQLRLMAIAYNNSGVGHAQATLIVRDPVIEDVAVPRFLAPGDTAGLAVSLHNTDGVAGLYHLALTGSGAASVVAGHKLDYTLAVGQRVQDAVQIDARAVGIATIDGDLTGPGGYHVHRSWQISVRPAHYPLTLQQVAVQPKGGDFKIDPKLLASFAPGSLVTSIGYASHQGIDVPSLLQSLWLYPYGCTEQLASSAFPLLYYNQKALLGSAPANANLQGQDTSQAGVKDRVQTAIDTILDRQDASGVFGLWRVGDGEASAWLNVYAMDFLMRAKAAGFAVPDDALNRGTQNLLQTAARIDSGAQGTSYTEQGLEAPQSTLAYAEYVLAKAGQADIGLLRRMHDQASVANESDGATAQLAYWNLASNGNAPDANALAQPLALAQLSGALALMNDRGRADSAMQMAAANIGVTDYPTWWFDYAYYSEQRDLAGMIAIAADEGDTQRVNSLLQRLNGLQLGIDQLNTQDKAWLLAAASTLDKNSTSIALNVNGQAISGLTLPAAFSPSPAQINAGYSIRNDSSRDLFRTLTVTGAPLHALPALQAGYDLKKEYFTLDGKPLDPSHLRQNDRFIVSLSGQVDDGDNHRTVLVDLLPAGWEIDAPVTDDSSDYSFLGPLSATRVIEARDDRFVTAFDLGSDWTDSPDTQDDNKASLDADEFHVAYLVRVVTPGQFTLPEAVVNDMYRPALMARTAAGATSAAAR